MEMVFLKPVLDGAGNVIRNPDGSPQLTAAKYGGKDIGVMGEQYVVKHEGSRSLAYVPDAAVPLLEPHGWVPTGIIEAKETHFETEEQREDFAEVKARANRNKPEFHESETEEQREEFAEVKARADRNKPAKA